VKVVFLVEVQRLTIVRDKWGEARGVRKGLLLNRRIERIRVGIAARAPDVVLGPSPEVRVKKYRLMSARRPL
jgi:hypothetical protein